MPEPVELAVPSKDAKRKEKKEQKEQKAGEANGKLIPETKEGEELSEEDQQLKGELEMLVERLK
ncbi:hypothetical protein EWM64_g2591, partial [Hericium alpestre]